MEKIAGNDFPVFLVTINDETCEVAMARKEKKVGAGHKGFNFHIDSTITVEQDLARCDLTINLIETIDLMSSCSELGHLTVDRVWSETEKALESQHSSRFFEVLKSINVLCPFFQEVHALNVSDKHGENTFNHTMRVMDAGHTKMERFGLLVHDFGKGLTPKDDHPKLYKHDKLGEEAVISFCRRLKVPMVYEKFGVLCATQRNKLKGVLEMPSKEFVQWVLSLNKYFRDIMHISFLNSTFRKGKNLDELHEHMQKVQDLAQIIFEIEKRVTGKELLAEGFTI